MAVLEPEIQHWLSEFVARTVGVESFDNVVRRFNDAIIAGVPEVAADPELQAALDASTVGQLRAFLAAILLDVVDVQPAPEGIELARTVARTGRELGVLLSIYRVGQRAAFTYVNEIVGEADLPIERQPAALLEIWQRAGEWLSLSTEVLIAEYSDERERMLRSALTRRAQLVESILSGERVDLATASAALAYPLRGEHLALVLTAQVLGADAAARLDAVASRIAASLGSARPLVVPSGALSIFAWVGLDGPPDWARLDAVDIDGVRVAVGSPMRGLDGFVASHREARSAARMGTAALTRYDQVELVAMLNAEPAAMRTFVTRELRRLGAADPDTARLRETALAFLQHGANAAAQQLRIHRNTVRYRVQQAESLLGHPLDERRLQVEVALLCATTLDQ